MLANQTDPLFVHRLVAERARRRPDAIAICADGRDITFAELNDRANRVAHHLRDVGGSGAGHVVGICLDRCADLIIAQLAVLKSGAAFLPLVPTLPAGRMAQMISDAGASVILTATSGNDPALIDPAPTTVAQVIALDGLDVSGQPSSEPDATVTPGDLAYIIYTSGSTGRPKGVMVSHAALANMMTWHADYYALSESDRTTVVASPGFDASVGEVWPTLMRGGSLHLPDDEIRLWPDRLQAWLVERAITVSFQPTPLAELLLALHWPADTPLRVLLTAGDRLRLRPRAELPFRVVNNYGPTENTMVATAGPVDPHGSGLPSIGAPVDGVRAYVVDEELRRLPIGMTGELYLGGTGVARGYVGRPEMTADRFVPDPWTPGARLYRTGDLVRRLPDGALDFIGRNDTQVKIRGQRIELGEVESVLLGDPDVAQACVVAHEGRNLVAYVAPRSPHRIPNAQQLRAGLSARLPEFMVPAQYVILDALPQNSSGKVDRDRLPTPDPSRAHRQRDFREPEPGLSTELAAIWNEVLGVEAVGADDDFFELGGHSLFATQVAARINRGYEVDLNVADVFQHSTVEALADRVTQLRSGATTSSLPPIQPSTVDAPAPLSFQQEQVWFLEKLAPDDNAYHAQASLRVVGALDLDIFERALTQLVARHEILRTTFATVDEQPAQLVHPAGPVPLRRVDLTAFAEPERSERLGAVIREELERPFNVAELPLFRWTAVKLSEYEHDLLLVEHHFVHDGWSFTVLAREIEELYVASVNGRAPSLPSMLVQYADYCRWQRGIIDSRALDEQLTFWRQCLDAPAEPVTLPADHPRPKVQTFRGDQLRIDFPTSVTQRLREYGRANRATLFTTLLAGLVGLLHWYTGEADICIGSGFANRRQRESEDLVGMLVNTVVLRCDAGGEPDFDELVRRVRSVILDASANQEYPFIELVRKLNPSRDPTANPYYRVMFSFNDSPLPAIDLAGSPATVFERHNGSAKMDLNIIVVPRAERQPGGAATVDSRVTLLWEYNADIFDRSTMEQATQHYIRLLEAAVASPATPLGRLPRLDHRERVALLARGAKPQTPEAFEFVIPELFRQQVERSPAAIAISCGDVELSYAEVGQRADRLADTLRRLGVGPDQPVGVCLPRGVDLVVALLAVLEADGAYLPLDASHPPARLTQLVATANVQVVVTAREYTHQLPPTVRTVLLDVEPTTATPALPPSARRARPGHLAYVLYTSGSTGVPKAVAVPHRAVVRLVTDQQYAHFGPDQVQLLHSPVTFDASTFEIWGALLHGGRLAIAPPGRLGSTELSTVVRRHGVTTLWLTAGLFHLMAEEDLGGLASVRQLIVGGEAVSPAHLERARQRLPGCRLVDGYGPTEVTTFACCHVLAPDRPIDTPVPIGQPIGGTTAYVLDAELEPVPPGVAGELYLGGAGLARAYLGAPDLTADRFVPSPFRSAPGARLYRTGDLVRWRRRGDTYALEFMGRRDEQVKIRGHRIEPAEVEAALLAYPGIDAVHVGIHRGERTGPALVAYLVGRATPPRISELRQYAEQTLPEYLRPASYVTLPELPITANGKVDHRRLPAPITPNNEVVSVPPTSALERQISQVWSEVLGVSRVGIHDNFFELGGHSLLVIKVRNRLSEVLDREITLVDLYEHPTIHAIAARLARSNGGGDGGRPDDLDGVGGDAPTEARAHRRRASLAQLSARRPTPPPRARL